jgi:3-hydroxybutyryl-CoA dehydrogenase
LSARILAPKPGPIAIIGAGLMGQGCAQTFAAAGWEVRLQSLDDELFQTVLDRVRADLVYLAQRGVGTVDEVEPTLARITTTSLLDEALDGVDFVLECIWEDVEAKRSLFRRMEEVVGPEVVLATNTSVIRITEIAAACSRPERVVGAHWWNPPPLIPIVEIVPGEKTGELTVQAVTDLMARIGKLPVVIQKDAPGFVGNRLLHALYREALSIAEQGIADLETVDLVFKYGPGIRFPVMAPFEHMDLVGADLILAVQAYLGPHLEDSHEPNPLLTDRVDSGELGFKSGGAGFRTWSPEEQQAFRRRLLDHLARHLAESGPMSPSA